jgi:hypothetical protein
MRGGDKIRELITVVYQTLHRVAESQLRKERPDHTLQPTALVNETYLKLFGHSEIELVSRPGPLFCRGIPGDAQDPGGPRPGASGGAA